MPLCDWPDTARSGLGAGQSRYKEPQVAFFPPASSHSDKERASGRGQREKDSSPAEGAHLCSARGPPNGTGPIFLRSSSLLSVAFVRQPSHLLACPARSAACADLVIWLSCPNCVSANVFVAFLPSSPSPLVARLRPLPDLRSTRHHDAFVLPHGVCSCCVRSISPHPRSIDEPLLTVHVGVPVLRWPQSRREQMSGLRRRCLRSRVQDPTDTLPPSGISHPPTPPPALFSAVGSSHHG